MARLHKKTDESLQKYLCAFTAMCRRVCRLPPKEGGQMLIFLFADMYADHNVIYYGPVTPISGGKILQIIFNC